MRWYLLIFVLVFLLPLVDGLVVISPNPVSLSVKEGVGENFSFTLTNEFDFGVVDFVFENTSGFVFPSIELGANESREFVGFVERGEAGSFELLSEVSFKYLVDLPEGKQVHDVIINEQGFQPKDITIREGDEVRWTNQDTITRTVTGAGIGDSDVAADGGVFSVVFGDQGFFGYQDLSLGSAGSVRVINATEAEKVNNPDFNRLWRINLDVVLDPTDLEVSVNEVFFNVSAVGEVESFVEVENLGNETAQGVVLSSDPSWLIFDENGFDVGAGEVNIVTFKVAPVLLETVQTNRSYDVELVVEGLNVERVVRALEVFVPFELLDDQIDSDEGFLLFVQRWCNDPDNAQSIICRPPDPVEANVTVESVSADLPINISREEVYLALRGNREIKDALDRTTLEVVGVTELVKGSLPQITEDINETRSELARIQREQESREEALVIVVFFVVLVACVVAIGLYLRKYNTKKDSSDMGYRYNE